MSGEKEHYKTKYHPQYNLSKANIKLYNHIIDLDIDTIFEFGCNVGRHLQRLQGMGYKVLGMEINNDFVRMAIRSEINVRLGDETILKKIKKNSIDLCFTNSVLCHMKPRDAREAVKQMKRIAKKHVICVECVTKQHDFWWIHNYEKMGFKEILELNSHAIGDAKYILYQYG